MEAALGFWRGLCRSVCRLMAAGGVLQGSVQNHMGWGLAVPCRCGVGDARGRVAGGANLGCSEGPGCASVSLRSRQMDRTAGRAAVCFGRCAAPLPPCSDSWCRIPNELFIAGLKIPGDCRGSGGAVHAVLAGLCRSVGHHQCESPTAAAAPQRCGCCGGRGCGKGLWGRPAAQPRAVTPGVWGGTYFGYFTYLQSKTPAVLCTKWR